MSGLRDSVAARGARALDFDESRLRPDRVLLAALAAIQYRRVVRTLSGPSIPEGYWVNLGVLSSFALSVLGLALAPYLILPTPV